VVCMYIQILRTILIWLLVINEKKSLIAQKTINKQNKLIQI
jgi:hypothetical protein